MKEDKSFLEEEVLTNLVKCGLVLEKENNIGVAVSGGADSISLLTALKNILPANCKIFALTVNHNLRKEEETCSDADFVLSYCKKLCVDCKLYDVERGKINLLSKERKSGIEEAARFVRYKCFEDFIEEKHLDFLCLAHNSNDNEETILMRFLNGSLSLSGIKFKREKIVRPLLTVSRKQIEEYLKAKNISWCTDSTNSDIKYFRNRIRNVLVPLLNENFTGWQKSLNVLQKKSLADEEYFSHEVDKAFSDCKVVFDKEKKCLSLEADVFYSFYPAVLYRLCFKIFSMLKITERVPFSFIERLCDKKNNEFLSGHEINCAGLYVHYRDSRIFFEIKEFVATEKAIFAIIEKSSKCSVGKREFYFEEKNDGIKITCENSEIFVKSLKFPFVIRTKMPGDEIKCADGNMKSLTKAVSSLKADESLKENADGEKNMLLLIQELQTLKRQIVCIWGSVNGFSTWLLKDWL